jgi:putative ABC transport system permease protein
MLRNFLITSLRILWRNKLVSAINILSLSIGITAFILILLYVHHETSYDKFNENYDRIYRLEGDEYAKLPPLIGEYIADKIPEIEKVTKLQITATRNFNYISPDNPDDRIAIPLPVLWADSTIFDVFTLPLVSGNPKYALDDPFEIVLSESFARRMFGDQDPMGKTIVIDNQFRTNNEFKVTGILKDIHQSHVEIDAIVSRESAKISHPHRLVIANQYTDIEWWTGSYLLLTNGANSQLVEQKINQVLQDINDESMLPFEFRQFHLRPLEDLYLKGRTSSMIYGEHGNNNLIWSFMAVGVFVLLLAMINYINLTTARSTLRLKEIIIKKVVGSSKLLLGTQFIIESIILVFLSFLIALTTMQLTVPKFNQLAQVHIDLSQFNTPFFWTSLIVATLALGLLSGTYPAFALSRLHSTANMPSKSKDGIQGARLRRILLTFQFSISIVLIIGIITNLRQLHFVKNADPGFNKEQVILVHTPGGGGDEFRYLDSYRETFKEGLLQNPEILNVSLTGPTLDGLYDSQIEINGKVKNIKWKMVDPEFFELLDIKLVEGRNFSRERLADVSRWDGKSVWLINDTAAKEYWNESPVGKTFYRLNTDGTGANVPVEIIGVVNDAHWISLHHKVEPMAYTWWKGGGRQVNIKVATSNLNETIKSIEREWNIVYGSEPFTYSFLDEEFDAQYKSDERIATIIGYFTVIAVVIACMGLFGLSSFMAVRRTKEIGIRKALGASSKTIFVMLSREYIKWILLSAVIASPIAWYVMNKWLETFAYRIELGPSVFILAAFIALAIGLITVGWQALKSAVANPVEALRYE